MALSWLLWLPLPLLPTFLAVTSYFPTTSTSFWLWFWLFLAILLGMDLHVCHGCCQHSPSLARRQVCGKFVLAAQSWPLQEPWPWLSMIAQLPTGSVCKQLVVCFMTWCTSRIHWSSLSISYPVPVKYPIKQVKQMPFYIECHFWNQIVPYRKAVLVTGGFGQWNSVYIQISKYLPKGPRYYSSKPAYLSSGPVPVDDRVSHWNHAPSIDQFILTSLPGISSTLGHGIPRWRVSSSLGGASSHSVT